MTKARTIRSGKSTFVDAAFDDVGNTTNRPAPRKTIKKNKTTIVTDFEN